MPIVIGPEPDPLVEPFEAHAVSAAKDIAAAAVSATGRFMLNSRMFSPWGRRRREDC
jgi:hypothetical protein